MLRPVAQWRELVLSKGIQFLTFSNASPEKQNMSAGLIWFRLLIGDFCIPGLTSFNVCYM